MQRELIGGFKHFDVSSLGFPDVYTIIPVDKYIVPYQFYDLLF